MDGKAVARWIPGLTRFGPGEGPGPWTQLGPNVADTGQGPKGPIGKMGEFPRNPKNQDFHCFHVFRKYLGALGGPLGPPGPPQALLESNPEKLFLDFQLFQFF